MKRLLILLCLLTANYVVGQSTMNIYQTDGTVLQIPLHEIDSVTHTVGGSIDPPTVVTLEVECIRKESIESGGEVTDDGGMPVTDRGVCWATTPGPTTADNVILSGGGLGAFNLSIEGLTMNTTYYIRAFATNGIGTAYGQEITFTTAGVVDDFLNASLTYGEVTDIDGNTYATVVIGAQEWMAENLRTATYANGDPIPNVTDDSEWSTLSTGAWAIFGNDCDFEIPYGHLYNWFAVDDDRNICPAGWHVATEEEYGEMKDLYGGLLAGGPMKSAGDLYWLDPNIGGTNESGFSALPGGLRESDGFFNTINVMACYWTATAYGFGSAFYQEMSYGHDNIYTAFDDVEAGFSVRCVKD